MPKSCGKALDLNLERSIFDPWPTALGPQTEDPGEDTQLTRCLVYFQTQVVFHPPKFGSRWFSLLRCDPLDRFGPLTRPAKYPPSEEVQIQRESRDHWPESLLCESTLSTVTCPWPNRGQATKR